MKRKKYQRRYAQAQGDTRQCEWEGCECEGQYPAPKSPQELNIRKHFCLEHVRQYNRSWNYFSEMSEEDGVRFQEESITGHRPTWKMGVNGRARGAPQDHVLNALHDMFGDDRFFAQEPAPSRLRLPKEEQNALDIFSLGYPVGRDEVKRRYKQLVKKFHPDVAGKSMEDRFKAIVHAYHVLKTSDYIV